MNALEGCITALAAVAAGRPLPVESFGEWRDTARELLLHDVAPAVVRWHVAGSYLPSGQAVLHLIHDPHAVDAALRVPRNLLDTLECAACCRVADRWALLYRVLWRWQHGDEAVLSHADADGARLLAMAEAVQREEHDIHARIRFRERSHDSGAPRFVAWCEPAHDVLPQLARHFAGRMRFVSWMIATPDASVLWDGAALHDTGPPLRSPAGVEGGGEAPWLAFYRGLAAPPRTGVRAMGQPPRRDVTIPINAAGAPPCEPQHPASLLQCRRCDLWQHATQAVGGAGPRRARIMLVGEQPGDQEDLAGQPFVGPAGKLLARALAQAGLDRRKVYLTNAVKHFKWEPRGKRRLHKTPAQREIEACGYWLEKELAQVCPDLVVAMGSTALKALLHESRATLKDSIGKPIRQDGRWIVAIYHPSYVLRVPDPDAKEVAFEAMVEGLKLAQRLLAGANAR